MTQTLSVSDLMASSGVAFGTSGARGLVTAMTDRVCYTYARAFLQHMASEGQFGPGTAVALAGDLRPSTPRIMAACAAAVSDAGGVVVDCGFVPSPAVAAHGFALGVPSLMVTGSHIPDDRNGIKFNRADGEVLKPDETAIKAQDVAVDESLFDADGQLLAPPVLDAPVDVGTAYVARYAGFFGSEALKGLKLGVYQHSAVGRDIVVDVVRALGAEVVALGRSERFIPVDTEAVRPEDVVLAREWSAQYGLDAILSTDGDSDRPLLADETGTWLRGDVLGVLCARALGLAAVATPVSSNSALELSGWFADVRRTRIGSPFVIEAMNALLAKGESACGYEANGGFILGSAVTRDGRTLGALPTRDAVLPMVAVLADARAKGLSLAALQAQLPPRFTNSERLQNYPTSQSQALLAALQQGAEADVLARLTRLFGDIAGGEAQRFDATDGLRTTFASGDIIHLRPSGNAPELRVYTESATAERAASLNQQALDRVRDLDMSAGLPECLAE
ncbi:phosphomannomutase [Novosphingobium pokkalii]|uniref:Phosphomannomutase n=1 Tax=Novosphingobium pokkalii TaxID=1770194 RepID=A0ABV7V3N0_9SPHN|nr:phosphomannomutase [Novosphingobium pokkalii]GHC91755.1 phosphomannomutase [Novosphingobium pokkalii]